MAKQNQLLISSTIISAVYHSRKYCCLSSWTHTHPDSPLGLCPNANQCRDFSHQRIFLAGLLKTLSVVVYALGERGCFYLGHCVPIMAGHAFIEEVFGPVRAERGFCDCLHAFFYSSLEFLAALKEFTIFILLHRNLGGHSV